MEAVRLKKILTIIFTIIVLSACTGDVNHYDYTFNGEGEYWKAKYSFIGTEKWDEKDGKKAYSNNNNDEFVLTYKGTVKELSSIKSLEYSYETSAGSGSSKMEFDKPPTEGTFTNTGHSENGAKVNADEVIPVKVKWNDHEESFELQNTSNVVHR